MLLSRDEIDTIQSIHMNVIKEQVQRLGKSCSRIPTGGLQAALMHNVPTRLNVCILYQQVISGPAALLQNNFWGQKAQSEPEQKTARGGNTPCFLFCFYRRKHTTFERIKLSKTDFNECISTTSSNMIGRNEYEAKESDAPHPSRSELICSQSVDYDS